MISMVHIFTSIAIAVIISSRSRHKVVIFGMMLSASLLAVLGEAIGAATLGRLFEDKIAFLTRFSPVVEEPIRILVLLFAYERVFKRQDFGFWECAFSGLCFGIFEHSLGFLAMLGGTIPRECSINSWSSMCAYSILITPLLMHVMLSALYFPTLDNKGKCTLLMIGAIVIHYGLNTGILSETYHPSSLFGVAAVSHTLSLIFILMIGALYLRWSRLTHRPLK